MQAAKVRNELASRISRKFPKVAKCALGARMIGGMLEEAAEAYERAANSSGACDCLNRAALVYANAELWDEAALAFESVGGSWLCASNSLLAKRAFANAALCKIGELDVLGAEQKWNACKATLSLAASDAVDLLLRGVFAAYHKWSTSMLDRTVDGYEKSLVLAPWQVS